MSALTNSIAAGVTRQPNGEPLGLVNWMVYNRSHTSGTKAIRVGTRIGYLWWTIVLVTCRTNFHIWEELE